MEALKKVGHWLRDNPWAIIVSLVGVFGAYLLFKSKSNKIASLKDAVAVQAIKGQIAADEREVKLLVDGAEDREVEVQVIDEKIAASQRRIVEIHEGGQNLEEKSDDEIAALFSDSGL
jgi:hypothetical protein